ncbi:MAG: TCR/Tet family MFS transporter [Pseudomonadota bacterium]
MARTPGKTAFAFIFLTVLVEMIGVGIILPALPALIQNVAGVQIGDAAKIGGLLTLVFALGQFFCSPIVGALSDRIGRRPVLIGSLLGYGVDYLIMGFAPLLAVLFVGRALSGAFAATVSTANAYIADISPAEERGGRFGMLGAAFGLGFIIGPAIGGWIGGEFGPRAPFITAGCLALANAAFGFFVLPETLKPEDRRAFDWRRANPVGGLMSVGKNRTLLAVLASFFLIQTAWMVLPSTWPFFTTARLGWEEKEIGWSLAYVGLLAAFVQGFFAGRVIKALGEGKAALLGVVGMVGSFLFYTVAADWRVLYAGLTVGAVGGLVMPALQSLMSNATARNEQGELQGALASVMAITMIVGPFTFTQVFGAFAPPDPVVLFLGAPYALATALLVVGGLAFAAAVRGAGAPAPSGASLPAEGS